MSKVEERLKQLGYALPPPIKRGGEYVHVGAVRSGNLVFLSGVPPRRADGSAVAGKLGKDIGVEEGYEAARLCALNLLANLKEEIGDLDKVTRVVKVLGMVNSTPDFAEQPKVVNGCSELLVQVFGDRGRHARTATGMAAVPFGLAVHIEMVVEVAD